jgi:predicted dehydrogenase
MEKKLKIGVVGCGGIATWGHMPAYEKMDNVEIVAFCDIIKERAEKLRNDFRFKNARVYDDFNSFIEDPDIEAVDVCTPNYLHSVFAVEALNRGKYVFCEKPDAVNPVEAQKMADAAEKSGKTLMVMRNNRYTEGAAWLKNYIDAGKAGEIYCGRCGWVRRRGIPGKGGWFTTKEQSGGGPMIDLGVHMIDLAIYLMGGPRPVAVTGCTYNKFANDSAKSDSAHSAFGDTKDDGIFDVEDLAMGFIRFDNGACLQIEFSWASNIEEERNFVELRGTKAGFTWEKHGSIVRVYTEEGGALTNIDPLLTGGWGGHEGNLRHFVDVVLNGAKPNFVPAQGVDMIKILNAFYESAEAGHEVAIEL